MRTANGKSKSHINEAKAVQQSESNYDQMASLPRKRNCMRHAERQTQTKSYEKEHHWQKEKPQQADACDGN